MPGLIDQGLERTTRMDKEIFSAFSQRIAVNKEAVAQIRKEKGLSDDECIYCGEKIEAGRLVINAPDCLKCHLEKKLG